MSHLHTIHKRNTNDVQTATDPLVLPYATLTSLEVGALEGRRRVLSRNKRRRKEGMMEMEKGRNEKAEGGNGRM